jgi:ketosteroid isomerase-like protein
MSAMENKKLMEDIFAAVAAGNRTTLLDSLADDVTMRVTGQNSWSRTFHGKASAI